MSEDRSALDLRGLEQQYEIEGELRGNGTARYYIGRTRDVRAAEVAIVVVQKASGGETGDLAHFAADSQILAGEAHPAIIRVLESRWVGSDRVAMVTDRVVGDSLAELLERGERFPNARIARILEDVTAALDWAREAGVVHRGVTPDTLLFERGTGRVRVSFVPTLIPMTGIPDEATDARTIGKLAWAFLTGEPYSPAETRSLAEVCPNLATRVVDATDKIVRSKDHADRPDVDTYLGILAAGDVLKQAEVELLAQKEEYDEAHRLELQKCDLQRQEVEQHAAEQASILAGEREEFQREMADLRAQLEAERAQFEALSAERKERFAAVRAELDEQRAELERRTAELDRYRAEVEKVRDGALAAREEAKAAREEAKAAANKAAEAAAAHAAAVRAANEAIARAAQEAAARAAMPPAGSAGAVTSEGAADVAPSAAPIPTAEEIEAMMEVPVDVPVVAPFVAPKLAKPPKPPKWDKISAVDLEHTDEDAIAVGNGRPRWLVPIGVGTLAIIVAGTVYSMTHRPTTTPPSTVQIGNSTVVPTAPVPQPTGNVPRGGFLTQSASGAVTNTFAAGTPTASGTAATTSTTSAPDSTAPAAAIATTTPAADAPPPLTQAQQDSIAEARAARARRAAAARERATREAAAKAAREAEARRNQYITDSLNMPSSMWNMRRDTIARPDTVVRPSTVVRPIRPDSLTRRTTVMRPDSFVTRDSIRPRPDTLVKG
jgi:hypothetical protein